MFFIFCILMLWHVGPCWFGRDCPSQDQPTDSKQLALGVRLSNTTPTNPEPTPQPPSLLGSHTLGYCLPVLIAPGPGTRQLGTAPMPRRLLKSFKLAKTKPAQPVLPIPSHRNHSRDSYPQLPLSLCLPTGPGAFPCGPMWPGMPPPPGKCE